MSSSSFFPPFLLAESSFAALDREPVRSNAQQPDEQERDEEAPTLHGGGAPRDERQKTDHVRADGELLSAGLLDDGGQPADY